MNDVRSEDGTRIVFDRSGDGPPVVVVGGALNDRATAAPMTAALSPHFTAYAYDRRGRGASGDTQPYSVEREVEDLDAVIGEAGGSAFVYGHSSGGVLALEAAARGLPIMKLALYEPPFIVDDSRPPIPKDYVARLEGLASSGKRGDAVAYFMTKGVGLPVEFVEQMRNAPMWQWMEELAPTLAYDGIIMGDTMSGSETALPTEWKAITTATLVMDGGESPAWQRHAVQALCDILPHALRRSIEGQDHGAAPEAVAPALVEFFGG